MNLYSKSVFRMYWCLVNFSENFRIKIEKYIYKKGNWFNKANFAMFTVKGFRIFYTLWPIVFYPSLKEDESVRINIWETLRINKKK